MTTSNQRAELALCRACGHDLAVRTVPAKPETTPSGLKSNGRVYCTNHPTCGWSRRPYQLSPYVEDGGSRA